MAVVHGIVEAHGGTISVDSSVGQGTTVSIALPRCSADEAFSASAESSDPPGLFVEGRGETILVAEDNPEVRTMIEAQLRSAGFGVLSTCDGKQVLDVVQKQAAEIQAVLLDIDLPEKDGLTCLKEINDQYPQLPVIMMSGLSSADPKKLATAFLRKPFSRKRLLSAIRDVLSTASAHKANGVLIVDDNEAVRVSTRDMFDNEDFDVFAANNGSEAASELRQHRDLIGTVLLDWNIPHTDPLATLHELRRISPGVRILVVSGDLTLQASEIEAKGFSRLLRKPFSGAELIEAVA
ncbi:MAG: hybrid sensor histidine kinase/response regulator [Fuerstiella sp.]|nr:hybrid sensor histidine kinase/response regulator [Fuerstiella sp.]